MAKKIEDGSVIFIRKNCERNFEEEERMMKDLLKALKEIKDYSDKKREEENEKVPVA